jgi:hypothetical protein
MTNTTLLSQLYAYIGGIDANERAFIEKQIERDEIYSKPSLPLVHLANVMVDLQRSIRAENNKKAGAGSWERLAKRMEKTTPRETMAGIIINDGAHYLCDGFRAVRLPEPIEYKKAAQELDIKKILDSAAQNEKPLDLPSAGELKSHIALEKAKRKAEGGRPSKAPILWSFGEGLPSVNAEYLLDFCEVMPKAKLAYTHNTAPIYFKDDRTEAVLLPVRVA